MKKSPKSLHPHRKLVVQREVVAELKPLQLTHVVGGEFITVQSAPLCSKK
jgi:hypothetical protein